MFESTAGQIYPETIPMVFNVQHSQLKEQITLIEVSGDLDNETFSQLELKIKEAITNNCKKLLVDFTNVYGFCSAAEYVLIWANNTLEEKGGVLTLCCGNLNVMDLMNAFGMDKILNIFDTRAKAIEFLNLY